MCIGPELALIAAGTALSAGTQMHAMRKQDREAAEGLRRQGEIQQRAGRRVQQQIQELQASNPEGERKAASDQFMTALRKARTVSPTGGDAFSTPGATSNRFASDVSSARATADDEAATSAGQLARIDAPMLQRVREGQRAAATASDLSMLDRDSAAEDFLTRMRVSRIAPNPWLSALGQGASQFGMARAGRALPTDTLQEFTPTARRMIDPTAARVTRTPFGTTTLFGG